MTEQLRKRRMVHHEAAHLAGGTGGGGARQPRGRRKHVQAGARIAGVQRQHQVVGHDGLLRQHGEQLRRHRAVRGCRQIQALQAPVLSHLLCNIAPPLQHIEYTFET